jgi:hypothetical protein
MVHGIIGEKGNELPKGDPRIKYKGRAVVLGDRVFDQDYETATFADLGSAPRLSREEEWWMLTGAHRAMTLRLWTPSMPSVKHQCYQEYG